jgi:hypothetical protein
MSHRKFKCDWCGETTTEDEVSWDELGPICICGRAEDIKEIEEDDEN